MQVQMPNGVMLDFPDGTPPERMQEAARRYWAENGNKPAAREYGWGNALADAGKNLLPSAVNAGTDIVNAALHPVDTVTALGNVALGTAQKLVPGEQDSEKYADAMLEYFSQRYGGLENLKRSVAADPVGVLSDFSTVFSGGAGALKGLAGVAGAAGKANAAGALGKAAGMANKAATLADPAYVAARAAGKLADVGYGQGMSASQKLYQSALKPSTVKNGAERTADYVQAGIDERIPITSGGIKKANAQIGALNDALDKRIAEADAAGRSFDPLEVAVNAQLSPARKELAKQADPTRDLRAFDRTLVNYLDKHAADTSIGAAQDIKKGTYRQLEKKKAFNNNTGVLPGAVDAQRELASQLRQTIEKAVPEARNINAQEGRLLGLRDELERAIVRTGNHNIFGLVPMLAGGMTGGATGSTGTGAATAALMSALGTPGVKSRAAFLLDDLSRRGNPQGVRNALATLYAGEQAYNGNRQEAGATPGTRALMREMLGQGGR